MVGIIVFAVIGLVLLFPVVMTRLAKLKLAQLERAKATIANHEARLAAEERAKNTRRSCGSISCRWPVPARGFGQQG